MSTYEHLRSVRQLAEANPAFTEASIHWLVFNAKDNGFDEVIVRVGRRVLLDIDRFNKWLEERRASR